MGTHTKLCAVESLRQYQTKIPQQSGVL